MESIQGKQSLHIEPAVLTSRLAGYQNILVDIGTGDGRFIKSFAETHPDYFAVGIDTCRENLHVNSHLRLPNALYLICAGRALPTELYGRTTLITINFPWGSLLGGLLEHERSLLLSLSAIAQPGAVLEVRINADALQEFGWSLDNGSTQIQDALMQFDYKIHSSVLLGPHELRACKTTWAKRLAFGHNPRALCISAEKITTK